MSDEYVKGLDDLLEVLKQLGPNLHKNAMRTAVFRAAQEATKEIKAVAPVGGISNPKGKKVADKYPVGSLKKGFRASRGRADQVGANAGVKGVFYAKFVEFGHMLRGRSETYTDKNGKTRKRKGSGEVLGHVPARPFIGPTFEAIKDRLIDTVTEAVVPAIKDQLEKANKKLSKK